MKIKILAGEHWWGFNSIHAPMQPFDENTKYRKILPLKTHNQSKQRKITNQIKYVLGLWYFRFRKQFDFFHKSG